LARALSLIAFFVGVAVIVLLLLIWGNSKLG